MDNIIYYLCGLPLFCHKLNIQGCKIGSTIIMKPRMKNYRTGYPDKVPLICYYKINKNCYDIDDKIQHVFNEYRLNTMGSEGGTEIYNSNIITPQKIEKFFRDNEIEFKKCLPSDLDFEEYKKKITRKEKESIIDEDNNKEILNSLHNWQKEAIKEIKIFFSSNEKCGLIIAPTGSGKSYLMNYISICIYIYKTNNDVIIMTKRKEILDDDFIKNGNEFINKLNLNIEFIDLINTDKNYMVFSEETNKSRIFIINIDKFISSNRFNNYTYSFGKIKLLLFDECHWCGAKQIFNFINYMKNNVVDKIIGFSATPIRQHEENKDNSLEIFKNSNNEYNIIYIRSYLESIEEGDRVKTYWIPIKTNFLDNEINDENEMRRGLNEKGFEDFTKILDNFIIKSIYKKGILWFANIQNLIDYYNFIKKHKNDYTNLSNISFFQTHSKETTQNLNIFKSFNNNAILLSVMRATEGYDDKPIDFGFNVYTIKSSNPLLDQQKEGRVSRTFENKKCGYFGFLINEDNQQDQNDIIAKRLADWIDYMKEFDSNNSGEKNKNKKKEPVVQDYMNIILDPTNSQMIDFDNIKKKIFKLVEKIKDFTSPSTIKMIMHKENKKRLINKIDLIDTKEKYDEYAKEWGLVNSKEIKNVKDNNWVKLLRPDFDDFITPLHI